MYQLTATQSTTTTIAVPTPKEYRERARECVELTNEPNEWYVKTALLLLAAEFRRRAEKLERT